MRTARKNFRMMLRCLMWEAPINTGAVRQDGHIVDTKIPSAILPCFSLRTECRGNELLMLHPPSLLCGLGQERTQITTPELFRLGLFLRVRKWDVKNSEAENTEQSPAFWDEKQYLVFSDLLSIDLDFDRCDSEHIHDLAHRPPQKEVL